MDDLRSVPCLKAISFMRHAQATQARAVCDQFSAGGKTRAARIFDAETASAREEGSVFISGHGWIDRPANDAHGDMA